MGPTRCEHIKSQRNLNLISWIQRIDADWAPASYRWGYNPHRNQFSYPFRILVGVIYVYIYIYYIIYIILFLTGAGAYLVWRIYQPSFGWCILHYGLPYRIYDAPMAFGGDLERVPIQERQTFFKQTEMEQTNKPGSETSFAISFSRMRSEGFSFGRLQVCSLESCSPSVARATASVRRCSQWGRYKPPRWATLKMWSGWRARVRCHCK